MSNNRSKSSIPKRKAMRTTIDPGRSKKSHKEDANCEEIPTSKSRSGMMSYRQLQNKSIQLNKQLSGVNDALKKQKEELNSVKGELDIVKKEKVELQGIKTSYENMMKRIESSGFNAISLKKIDNMPAKHAMKEEVTLFFIYRTRKYLTAATNNSSIDYSNYIL